MLPQASLDWHTDTSAWGIRRSVPRTVFQSLVSCLVLSRLDYCNAVLAGILLHLARRLQSVMNAAARLVFASSKCDHITPLLRQLHWLKVPWRIEYKLAVLVYKCLHGLAPSYLADELHHPQSWSFEGVCVSAFRFVSRTVCSSYTRLSIYGDRAFPVAAVRIWNSLEQIKGHGTKGHRTKGHRQKATRQKATETKDHGTKGHRTQRQDATELSRCVRLRVVLKTVEQIVLYVLSVLVCRFDRRRAMTVHYNTS